MESLIELLIKLAVGVSLTALTALIVQFLWNNCLIGAVDGVHDITWLQSWGIVILTRFLIRGIEVNPK